MWDMEVEECAELGHDFNEISEYDYVSDGLVYSQACTWCGTELED